ncbi:hypothetical protein COEREDRAFT_7072 [Coemansia reversa NRRL 1564]|uniref:Uncharacterized protein n=1 Tax=Coemansia reversa (strain ATCC 12441 / NRRL 1564) TaxID=763665 RepID=A0A2G5BGP8_COERN|nr:hypothetical protein COEREDRAFT_7072 [Coemansia reversa NRRL 1564]|eukprot:PIA17887.1 hypothetical protein COEREDRAFT_7072 [Coemansia reversa NRRL 1564]
MNPVQSETSRILSVLQGEQSQFEGSRGVSSMNTTGLSMGVEASLETQPKASIWAIPASVGPDLTKPVALGEIAGLWHTLDETQKINVLLGIAHVGQGRMRQAAAEVQKISQLAKKDFSSDWVRTLGELIGDVGISGKMHSIQELEEPTKSEIENVVQQLATVLEKSSLCVTMPELGYVSSAVARTIAPSNIRNMYGRRPHVAELRRVATLAKEKHAGDMRSPSISRRQSMAWQPSRRESSMEVGGSGSSSQIGSPEPSSASGIAFSALFEQDENGAEFEDGGSDSSGDDVEGNDDASVVPNVYTLRMNVKSSHQADHVGRLARLLAAADNTAALGNASSATQSSAASDGRRSAVRSARGGHATPALGMRRVTPGASGAANKVGMVPNRKRPTATNLALPGGGLGSATITRRGGDTSTMITQKTKKIQMVNLEESAVSINARDRLMRDMRDQKAEEREVARQKRQAEIEERKRRREEARQQRESSTGAKRPRRKASGADGEEGSGSSGGEYDSSDSDAPLYNEAMADADAATQSPVPGFEVPSEYRTFAGNTPQIESVYAQTNALSDIDRIRMYCFFNGLRVPPGTTNPLEILLNERVIDDPVHQGKKCTELLVFKANLEDCNWTKVRRLRRS